MANKNIVFHLSKGNPSNDPVGLSAERIPYGKSLGGEIFRSETINNSDVVYHSLQDENQDLFDPIVPSDFIKNQINYRCVYITNLDSEPFILDEVNVSDVVKDDFFTTALTDVDIAYEGVYTIHELSRPIPNDPVKPGNPSMVLDDEYDSTGKLADINLLTFKKTLDANDLPAEIPNQSAIKIWVRRVMVVDKLDMPDGEGVENFTLSVKEFDTDDITSVRFDYTKLRGRVSLANWFDYTITPGTGSSFIMHELIPKEVDITEWNVVEVFAVNKKIIIFYSQRAPFSVTELYYALVIDPADNADNNKYVQISMTFQEGLDTKERYVEKSIVDIKKSFYDSNKFYVFWKEEVSINDPCTLFYFGFYERYDRIAVDELTTYLWTDSIFVNINPGWDNRRVESHEFLDRKIVRKNYEYVNMEQIDDLFILFTRNTTNKALLELNDINLNRNELLYIFEKDIDEPNKYTSFNNFPGVDAEVLSQRLLPSSIPSLPQITSFNNAKNVYTNAIISDSTEIPHDVISGREIKYLLDGNRYVDENSFHGREFKVGNRFITYEFPVTDENITAIIMNTGFKIENDEAIYSSMKEVFGTTDSMINKIDGETVPLAWFQQNVIDVAGAGTTSIPLDWADRNYKDEWIKIVSTLPDSAETTSPFTLEYNFARNLWRTIHTNENDDQVTTIHNKLDGQASDDPTGKVYTDLVRKDLQYVLEPGHYQPLTVEINVRSVQSGSFNRSRFLIRYQVYFKGSSDPIVQINAYSRSIENLSYIFINPSKTLNISMNYMDVFPTSSIPKKYYIQNLHKSILNELEITVSKEIPVDPQRSAEQSNFNFYRAIEIDGIVSPLKGQDQSGDVTIPIILYGNGYVDEAGSVFNENLEVRYPFDFSKLYVNDRSMRIYSENNLTTPLSFKVGYYDYDLDMMVLWVRLQDFGISNKRLFMYYNKVDVTEDYTDVLESYIYLKNNIYSSGFIGAWHFDSIVEDARISFVDGAIYEAGDPVIYEKSLNDELRLTRIEKEYFYGIAKVYKSNYFDIEIDVPAEESLFFDEDTKNEFVGFIKDVARVFKPGYSEVNEVKPFGIEILEAGEGGAGVADNKRVAGLIALTANDNVNTYYERLDSNSFDAKTSFNGYNKLVDWVIAKPIDSTLFKSGTFKVSGRLKSETIKFITPFKNTDYFVFFSSPSNDKLYWEQLCENRFTVTSSHYLTKEISWMAFHRDMFGGVFTPDSIFVGKRTIDNTVTPSTTGEAETEGLEPNLRLWTDSTLIIQPEVGEQGDPGEMLIDPTDPGYSILLSSNENINMYWTDKEDNNFTIKTSSPEKCIVHWAVIKNGIEWWQEIV